MKRDGAGRTEITSTAGEEVRAFVPAPLPPDPPVLIAGALQALRYSSRIRCQKALLRP
ncbi:MAG: hypothetical protein ACKO02_06700 [Cyanobium sp.]